MLWYYMYPPTEEVEDLPFYVISLGLHDLQPRIERKEGYPYDQFFFNSCGSGWLEMNGEKYELKEGCAFFIPANLPHRYYPDGDVWDIRWMVPAGTGVATLIKRFHLEKGGVFELADETGLDRILTRMRRKLIDHPLHGPYLAAGDVYEYILEFVYQTILRENSESEVHYEAQFLEIKEYIDQHFMHQITLDDLCQIVPVTHQHMCRIFKDAVGLRPMEYIAKVRIEMAKSLLIYTENSIKDIALKCGFVHTNYFCKIFKKLEKVTPLEYRNSVL